MWAAGIDPAGDSCASERERESHGGGRIRCHRASDDLAHRMIQFLLGVRIGRGALGEHRLDGLEERRVVTDVNRILMGHWLGATKATGPP